jgi:ferredoxin
MLPQAELAAFVAALMRDHRLIAPTRRDEELRYAEIAAPDEVVLRFRNTLKAPKAVFFPQTEVAMRFARRLDRFSDVEGVPLDTTPTVLLGVRPCDARSFLFLDRIFGEGQYTDPYYLARRKNTLVISLACDHPRATCFCHAFGSAPDDAQGADVLLRVAGDAYLVEACTERGEALLATLALVPADAEHREQAATIAQEAQARLREMAPVAGIEEDLAPLWDSPLWAEIAAKCIACGTCTYVCPECHCFNIEDRVLAETGERVRAWDACMFSTFTLHASGHNPRPDQAARWRQRTMHKFSYLPRNVGLYGCVGCGRCVISCPVRLDIRQVIAQVREAKVALAKTTP